MANRLHVGVRAGVCLLTLIFLTGCEAARYRMWKSDREAQLANEDLENPARLHLSYAQLSEKSGNVQQARHSYNNALDVDSKSVEAILGLARLDLLGDRVHQAEQGFLKALQVAPEDSRVAEAVGQFYITQDRFKEAAQHLLKGVQLDPGNKRIRHRLGMALARQGEISAAEPHFIEAVGAAEADYNIGLILYERGDIDQAEQRFLQATMKKPQLAQAHHYLDTIRQERASRGGLRRQQPSAQDTALVNHQANQDPRAPQSIANLNVPAAGNQMARNTPGPTSPGTNPLIPRLAEQPNMSAANPQARGPRFSPSQQRPIAPLDPSSMNATQLEQLENSMSPAERAAFRARLQNQ